MTPTDVYVGGHPFGGHLGVQECCRVYQTKVPVTYYDSHTDSWELLWKCETCKNTLNCTIDASRNYPRIVAAETVQIPNDTVCIAHGKVDVIQLRNMLDGIDIFKEIHDKHAPTHAKLFEGACSLCRMPAHEGIGESGEVVYRCKGCGAVYVKQGDGDNSRYYRYHGESVFDIEENDDTSIHITDDDQINNTNIQGVTDMTDNNTMDPFAGVPSLDEELVTGTESTAGDDTAVGVVSGIGSEDSSTEGIVPLSELQVVDDNVITTGENIASNDVAAPSLLMDMAAAATEADIDYKSASSDEAPVADHDDTPTETEAAVATVSDKQPMPEGVPVMRENSDELIKVTVRAALSTNKDTDPDILGMTDERVIVLRGRRVTSTVCSGDAIAAGAIVINDPNSSAPYTQLSVARPDDYSEMRVYIQLAATITHAVEVEYLS